MNSQNAFSHPMSLQQLGWQPVFQQQLTLEDYDHSVIARIVAHHRNGYTLASEQGEIVLPIHQNQPAMTVGDWVILNSELQFDRLLERQSLFSRKAAGSRVAEQYISANIDTVFIVVSLNNDFNLSRIERYLALANEAQVEAVIVLTKKDLCDDYQDKVQQVQSLDPMLMIEAVNSLDQDSTQVLSPWCKIGKTVALMGSSGVGKSTLVNSLLGEASQATGGIREDDSKGRHTTTSRSLHLLASGGLLLDTPGMRELQLADCAEGVSETFSDVEELAMHCRFSDCHHESEPGCKIRAAIESGELSERRFSNYEKLLREQARNGASLAEQRANSKQLSKMYKTVQSESRNIKKSSK
ncbi:ribosome small subunit-dependent GTPase A [Vibrio crassostreae]|uniref:ribosome small subunit-dependent GTPase A n=1 Tax=Vibrio crassostreae TaxID=246167 RepID=UPI00031D876B|nr:ribosome small subunit-dependent GTPase A [Vibrio crassostreae]OEE99396.1 ribosome small subunit-dependent GTPase A [Vibrio crassostreae 9ZC77]